MRLKLSHDGAVKPVLNPLLFDQFPNLGQFLDHIQNCLNTDPNDGNVFDKENTFNIVIRFID